MHELLHKLINRAKIKKFLTTNRWFVQLYFNFLYRKPDPYHLQSRFEINKFEHTFLKLENRSFDEGLEIGCGEGRNTWRIARICNRVLAFDISKVAIDRARKDNTLTNVRFSVFDIVTDAFDSSFDYIFCAETLYYLHLDQLDHIVEKIISATKRGGIIHLMHSRSLKDDHSGLTLKEFGAKTIHERFISKDSVDLLTDEQEPLYRITILQKK